MTVAAQPIGFDVTSLSPEDFRRRGIRLSPFPHVASVGATDRLWLTHSQVAVRYPSRDLIDRSSARAAAGEHFAKHGSLEGLRLHRTFPCLGRFRVENGTATTGPVIVVCDVCGDRFGVRRSEFDKSINMPPLS